jgi:18S rRNA (guanine1575-N7)-methyltransferase
VQKKKKKKKKTQNQTNNFSFLSCSSRMIDIQRHLAERALELLNLPPGEPCFLADLGCGSGLSGEVLSAAGHHWLGFDVSAAMLDVATQEETDGDLCLLDLGQGLPVRNAIFDGAIRLIVLFFVLRFICNM